jgi:Skp family chaperone for outer membrane proteins
MKLASLAVLISLALSGAALAQAPAAAAPAGPSRIAVIEFNRAVVETSEGKKATEVIKGEMTKKETEFTKAQGELETLQKQAQSQGNVLNDAAKSELARKIDLKNTELTRINEDAQKAMSELQEKHFGPIAQLVSKEVNAYATEQGYAVVFDISMQPSNIIHWSDVADITTEIIRRLDAKGPVSVAPAAPRPTPAATTPAPKAATPPATAPTAPKTTR